MTIRKKVIIALGLTAVLLFIAGVASVVIPYLVAFGSRDLSANPEQWGQFGDYIGGLLNPIISLCGVIITFIIALQVNKVSHQQSDLQKTLTERHIEAQKELLKIQNDFQEKINRSQLKTQELLVVDQIKTQKELLLTQFRYELLMDYKHKIDEHLKPITLAMSNARGNTFALTKLKDVLIEIREVDHSILKIPSEVQIKVLETIGEIESWEGHISSADLKISYLNIIQNTKWVMASLFSSILSF